MTRKFQFFIGHVLRTVSLFGFALIFLLFVAPYPIAPEFLAEIITWCWIAQGFYDLFNSKWKYVEVILSTIFTGILLLLTAFGRALDLSADVFEQEYSANFGAFVMFFPCISLWLLALAYTRNTPTKRRYQICFTVLFLSTIVAAIALKFIE